ncbi:MAG: heterodisulfide reductase-related iron-sulfur binding cluster [Candidatus Aminicenantales bacterium]
MLSSAERIIFIFIIVATFIGFILPVYMRFRIIRSGMPEKRFDKMGKRIKEAFSKVFLQRCTLRNERIMTGLIHVFIFYGALTFDTMTVNHTLEGFVDNFSLFGQTGFALFFSLIVDLFAVLVLAAVLFFAVKRYIIRPEAYATSPLDSGVIYFFLTAATLSYLYFECFVIASHPGAEKLSFLGVFLANTVRGLGLSPEILSSHLRFSWWLHVLIVYAFIVYVPHSKYFHMLTGPFNILFRSHRPMGELKALDLDMEKAEVFGVEKASDFSWKDLLDAFSCMECGRCQDACPAFASDKPLSPKMIVLNLKKHLLQEGHRFIGKKRDEIKPLMEDVYSEGEIWTCTTCGACMHVCPVEIEHIPKIVGIRQSQVLMESRFPSELNTFFRNMETNSNPWGIGFASRADWAQGLDVKLLSEHPEAEYLFWVGCAGSFDEEGKKIARAVVSIMRKAGVDFAILGTEEKCCGDSLRRLGNEYLFQMMAEENIQIFKKYNVKKIVVICPHGYNTFKNEYPRLIQTLPSLSPEEKERLGAIEIIHHVQLLATLIQEGRLPLRSKIEERFTYHDSCYLGRHNDIVDEPREILKALGSTPMVELTNSREHSFCCGAGGGLMWTEESLGVRINHLRAEEVIGSRARVAATSCPFCMTMLQDGLKDKGNEEIKARDIAQLVSECL